MRRVRRSGVPVPQSLVASGGAGRAELGRARTHFGTLPSPEKKFVFTAYKGDDVRHALEQLFFGKCAYCEGRYDVSGPVDIEHFRPKGEVDGAPDHPGYWWLAAVWTNLLPSCVDCNRKRWQRTPSNSASLAVLQATSGTAPGYALLKTGKESAFPLADEAHRVSDEPAGGPSAAHLAEGAMLIDPATDDPAGHLIFHVDREAPLGIVYPAPDAHAAPVLPPVTDDVAAIAAAATAAGASARGAVSIQIFGLNRLRLVQERTRTLRKLEFLAATIVDLASIADELENAAIPPAAAATIDAAAARLRAAVQRLVAEMRSMADDDAPFSTMAAAWIDRFMLEIS